MTAILAVFLYETKMGFAVVLHSSSERLRNYFKLSLQEIEIIYRVSTQHSNQADEIGNFFSPSFRAVNLS